MLHRLLLLLILSVGTVYFISNFTSIRREVIYKLDLSRDRTTSCCSEAEVLSSNGDFDEGANLAIFNGSLVDYPKTSLAYGNQPQETTEIEVLGTTLPSGEEKWIEVSLDEQKLRAYEGNRQVMEYPISSGKWSPTPTGTFNIWYKTRNQSMIGGSQALGTYYNLPNVPHNMFFHKGYAIHGAYWHNNFGQPMSHGCVNSPLANAAQIFDWAGPTVPSGKNSVRASADNPGTRVYVH